MRIAKVIGSVVLSRCVRELEGGRYLIVLPESADAIRGNADASGMAFVAYDGVSASPGARVAVSEGREAAQPFSPRAVPVDAYCAAMLDDVQIGWQPTHSNDGI